MPVKRDNLAGESSESRMGTKGVEARVAIEVEVLLGAR